MSMCMFNDVMLYFFPRTVILINGQLISNDILEENAIYSFSLFHHNISGNKS